VLILCLRSNILPYFAIAMSPWNSLEHDIHEMDDKFDEIAVLSSQKLSSSNTPDTVWNIKICVNNFVYYVSK
jgi:hypothetical protein